MGVAKAKRQCGRQKCFLRCLFYVLKYKTAYTFLLSIVVSINAAFPRLPLVPRGHVLSLYEEGEEPTVPLLGTSPPEIVCAKKGNAAALLHPNQSVDCKCFCFAKAN